MALHCYLKPVIDCPSPNNLPPAACSSGAIVSKVTLYASSINLVVITDIRVLQ